MKTFLSFLILGVALSLAAPIQAQQTSGANPVPVIVAHPAAANVATSESKMGASVEPRQGISSVVSIRAMPDRGVAVPSAAMHASPGRGTTLLSSAHTAISARAVPKPDFDARTIATPRAAPQPVLPPSKLEPVGQMQLQGAQN